MSATSGWGCTGVAALSCNAIPHAFSRMTGFPGPAWTTIGDPCPGNILFAGAGAPIEWISKQLGHTKIQTTISHYARWLPRADERIHALIDSYVEPNRTENGQSSESAR